MSVMLKSSIPAVQLQHGNSFRFVSRIVSLDDAAQSVTCEYDYCGNEVINLSDHFPGQPIFPGVLVLEAMAQSAIQLISSHPEYHNSLPVFRGVEDFSIKAIIDPPSTIVLCAQMLFIKMGMGKVKCEAFLRDKKIAHAVIVFALLKK